MTREPTKSEPSDRARSRRAAASTVLAAVVCVYGPMLAGYAPSGEDAAYHYVPNQTMAREAVLNGELPYWNSLTFFGRPLLADIQLGFFYPPNWLNWLIPPPWALGWLVALHAAWSMWGCLRLGRAWAMSGPAAALMGVLYTFGGFLTSKHLSGVVSFGFTAAWLPWCALTLTRIQEAPTAANAARLALALAMTALVGSPQMTVYCWQIVGCLALALFLGADGGKALARKRFGIAGCAALLTVGLLAAQLWPTFLMMRDSFTRGGALPWEYVVRGSLGPRDLILLLQPGVFGPPRDLTFYWNPGEASYSEACSFITVWAPFALAAAGFALLGPWRPGVGSARDRLHRRLYLGALAVAIAGALLALGRNSPPSRFIFQHLFGLNFFRVPARYMFWFTVGISVASALALDAWTRPALARRRRRLGGAIAAVGLCLAAIAILLIYVRRMDLWIAWGNPAFSAGNAQLRGAVERALSSNLLTFTARSLGFLVLGALALFAAMRVRTAAWALPLLAAAELGTLNWAIQDVTPVNRYRAAFYENQPQAEPPRSARSPVVAFMRQARSDRGLPLDGGRALWLDDLRYWQVDQNQPEITSNGLVMHGMAQARGYDPINSWWIVMWLNRMAGRDPLEDPGGYASVEEIAAPGMLALGGIDSVVSHRDLSPNLELAYALQLPLDPANDWIPDEPHFPEMRPHDYQPNTIGEGRLGVWMNPDFMGIAFAAPAGAVVDDASLAQETTAKALAAGAAPLEAVVYDSRILESGLQLTDAVDAGFVVRSIEGGPNVFRFEIEFPEPAALYFAQSAYPGWRATIDGHRAPIARACGTFMAVAVDAGRRSVEFRYAPPAGWGWAIAIGLMAAGIVGGAIGLEALKRKLLESIRADRGGVNPGPSAGPAD